MRVLVGRVGAALFRLNRGTEGLRLMAVTATVLSSAVPPRLLLALEILELGRDAELAVESKACIVQMRRRLRAFARQQLAL